jgi:hypothetical protein
MAVCLFALPFSVKRQVKVTEGAPVVEGEDQKIVELNQKTDGAIVLNFQGQEYKISKPELDSESDQFIDKLLKLVTPGSKEIEYDASKDEDANLKAPLSKLVTRLGFTGIIRDIFFPRTTKNMVLFRKFATLHDLTSMNINIDQLFAGLHRSE